MQVFYRYKALLEQNIDELAALVTEENGKIDERGARRGAQVGRADRVRLLAAADHGGRGARSHPRRRMPRRALPARRRRVDHAVQLPEHGAELDDPERDRPRQLHDPQAVRAGAAQRRPHRRAAARGRAARRRASTSCTADRRRSRRSAIIPASRRSASSARRRSRRSSTAAARRTLKRVLALGGAKNHLIVMPDADPEMASGDVVASMSGCAGQRCMAASVMVAVVDTDHIIERMVGACARDGAGQRHRPGDLRAGEGAHRARYITEAEEAGAKVLVDGRGCVVPRARKRLLHRPDAHRPRHARHADRAGRGLRAGAGDRAREGRGRGARGGERVALRQRRVVFTESGGVARATMENASAGMVGVNVGVPVPREPFCSAAGTIEVRRRRHHRPRLDRVLDEVEEDDDEVE